MIWHQKYSTIVIEKSNLPTVIGEPFISAQSICLLFYNSDSYRTVEVWRKLLESKEDIKAEYSILCIGQDGQLAAKAMMPKSVRVRCIEVDSMPRIFQNHDGGAIILSDSTGMERKCLLAMFGPPTEEAWDEFLSFWRNYVG